MADVKLWYRKVHIIKIFKYNILFVLYLPYRITYYYHITVRKNEKCQID